MLLYVLPIILIGIIFSNSPDAPEKDEDGYMKVVIKQEVKPKPVDKDE